jgi:hypothetical protein
VESLGFEDELKMLAWELLVTWDGLDLFVIIMLGVVRLGIRLAAMLSVMLRPAVDWLRFRPPRVFVLLPYLGFFVIEGSPLSCPEPSLGTGTCWLKLMV